MEQKLHQSQKVFSEAGERWFQYLLSSILLPHNFGKGELQHHEELQNQALAYQTTAMLLHLTQQAASGDEVDVNFICRNEYSNFPPSLYSDNGSVRPVGTNSMLVQALKEETKVNTSFSKQLWL